VTKLCFSFMRRSLSTRRDVKYLIFRKKSFYKIDNIQFGVSRYSEQANKQTALHELFLFRSSLFLMNNYKHTLFSLEWPFAETSPTFLLELLAHGWKIIHKKQKSHCVIPFRAFYQHFRKQTHVFPLSIGEFCSNVEIIS